MSAVAAECLFRCVYEGCISGCDLGVERRPYHRNCGCALHKRSKNNCPRPSTKSKSVSYPMRRSWSEGNMLLMASSSSSSSSSSATASSPSAASSSASPSRGLAGLVRTQSQSFLVCSSFDEMEAGFCHKI